MSLLSINITKVKRLSLKEIKLPTPEVKVEPTTPILQKSDTIKKIETDYWVKYPIKPAPGSILIKRKSKDYYFYYEPGSLAELEDIFIKGKNKRQSMELVVEIVRLLDKYKRVAPTDEQLTELRNKVNIVNTII